MREYVLAMRAIWATWNTGERLNFRGEFYKHTLMTPMFSPGPNPYGPPRVFIAGVGELMTEVAGEVGDGFLVHGFTTESYLRQVTLPALDRGLERSGKTRADIEVSYPGMVVTGETEEQIKAARQSVKRQLAFYGSTPAYKPVLSHHGWGDLQTELNTLSKRGEWDQMTELISDEIVDTFAAVGPPDAIPGIVLKRFGDVVDRFSFYPPYVADPVVWQAALAQLS
jgi:probable F420-dependent oxidoreductase